MPPLDIESLQLERVSARDLFDLIEESRHSFSAPAANPDEDTRDLFNFFEHRHDSGQDDIYQPLAYLVDGRPISYIVALAYKGHSIAIGPMYVSIQWRGHGLGAKQVTDFILYAKRNHFAGIYTKTWRTNDASRAIFSKTGFEVIGTKPMDRADGDDTVKYYLKM